MELPFSDMLRWLLLGIGVLVIAIVYWFSRRGRGKPPISQRVAPDLSRNAPDTKARGADERPSGGEAAAGEAPDDDQPAGPTSGPHAPEAYGQGEKRVAPHLPFEVQNDMAARTSGSGDGELSSRLLILHVRSKSKQKFSGTDIMRIAEQEGLERAVGSGGGFFRRNAPSPDDPPLFYIANMFSPGVFKWSEMDGFSTSGLSLFAQLPGALPPLEAFDELLECARRFADGLQGAVCDESRSDLTAQTIQHIKEELQVYAMGRAAPTGGK